MKITDSRRICPECGTTFTATHGRQQFCTPAEKAAFHNRQAMRGKVLVSLAQAWRGGKSKRSDVSSYGFEQTCKLLDRWNAEDRAAGRRPDIIADVKRRTHWNAADLDLRTM